MDRCETIVIIYVLGGYIAKSSLLDTKEDIQRRKKLTISHMKDKNIYKSKNLSIIQKYVPPYTEK